MTLAKDTPLHIVDFEGNQKCGIVEYGVVTLLGGIVTRTATRLCRAENDINARDIELHRIRNEDTLNCQPFSDEWELFLELRQSGPLCAHYAAVEHGLMKRTWPYPRKSPDFLNLGQFSADWGPWIDTCQLFQRIYPGLESYQLASLVAQFGLSDSLSELAEQHCPVERSSFHCALYDAIASALLLKYILALPGFEGATVAWLIHNSASGKKKDALRQLRFGDR